MSALAILLLAFSMSVDAFAVAVGRGAAIGCPRFSVALRTGAVFGLVEAITPLIGWAAGAAAFSYIQEYDHWVAFILLAGVGLHTLREAFGAEERDERLQGGRSLYILIGTAIGTSLDALAVGVSLAILDVNILVIAIAIGSATFIMASGGMMIGRMIGERFRRAAGIVAGVALCGLGSLILIEHLA